jgi:hypothetical protein
LAVLSSLSKGRGVAERGSVRSRETNPVLLLRSLSPPLARHGFGGSRIGRLIAIGKSETQLAVDVPLASRAVSRHCERADERPKVNVEALGVRRSRLCGDGSGVLEGSRSRQLTVQIAPRFGFGARDRRVRACIRFSREHREMIPKDGAVTPAASIPSYGSLLPSIEEPSRPSRRAASPGR